MLLTYSQPSNYTVDYGQYSYIVSRVPRHCLFNICHLYVLISVRCAEQNGSSLRQRMRFEIRINSLSGHATLASACPASFFLCLFFMLGYITQV
jgi:hypothetical protein